MKRLAAIARKEFLHILRDPRSLVVAIVMPMAMVLLYGYAIDMDMKQLPIGVIDEDRSKDSRELLRSMTSSGFITIVSYLNDRSEIEIGFRRNEFRAVVIVETKFSHRLNSLPTAPVQIIVDGSDGTTAASVFNYLNGAIYEVNRRNSEAAVGRSALPIETQTRIFYNPELKSANFIVPGLVAVVMMMICALLTSIALTREKEMGTLEQIHTTPALPGQVILGKVVPYLLIAALDSALVILIGMTVFGVPLNGSAAALAGYSFLYLMIALAFGILVSTIARTQQVAMMFALMVTMLPTLLLSGFIFPISSMPWLLQIVSRVIPATYYLQVLRGVMLKGANWFPVEGGIMLAMAALLLTAAMVRFKRGLA